jgi:hypothetical protein
VRCQWPSKLVVAKPAKVKDPVRVAAGKKAAATTKRRKAEKAAAVHIKAAGIKSGKVAVTR